MDGKALGRGLSALIPEKKHSEREESISYLKISQIRENQFQPRKDYNDEKLSDLMASIKEKGVLQPILVRPKDGQYEVIAGERRLRAARALEMEEVPAVIKKVSDDEALILALVENIQREELSPIEEAQAYRRLINDFHLTQDAVAQSVGKDRTTITNILRLLKLPEEIQQCLTDNTISVGHARALLSLENPQQQRAVFVKLVKKGLSVRELEDRIKKELEGVTHLKKASSRNKDPYIMAMEDEFQRSLGTKVRIEAKRKKGKIIIEYYSLADLDRIMEILKR